MKELIKYCENEIAWAKESLEKMEAGFSYNEEDYIYLPCWMRAHELILDLLEFQAKNVKHEQ